MTLSKYEEELQAKYNNLLSIAQDLCIHLDKCGLAGNNLVTDLAVTPATRRALRDLAVHCGCTHVTWWNKDLGN